MAFQSKRTFKIPNGTTLPEAMEKLRKTLQIDPASRPTLGTSHAMQHAPLVDEPELTKSAASAEEMYAAIMSGGSSFVVQRIDNRSLLSRQVSMSRLRLNLEECRALLNFLQAGPSRKGPLSGVKNSVTNLTRKVLNWFIAPSVAFDKATSDALNECAASIELLSKQVHVIADELAVLSNAANALGLSQMDLAKKLSLRNDRE